MGEAEIAMLASIAAPWLTAIGLAMARTAGILLGLPHATSNAIPRSVKGIVVLAISVGTMQAHSGGAPVPVNETAFVVGLIGEFALGIGFGFIIQIGLATCRIAGELAGIEMGLSFAAVADPLSPDQSTALSSIFAQLGIQLVIALGLDRIAIQSLAISMGQRPLGEGSLSPAVVETILDLGDTLMSTALRFALPLFGALFSLKIAMAMLARVAPKLQIFTLAFGLSITVGLIVLHAALPGIASAVTDHMTAYFRLVAELAARI